jgi:hypothetical protein
MVDFGVKVELAAMPPAKRKEGARQSILSTDAPATRKVVDFLKSVDFLKFLGGRMLAPECIPPSLALGTSLKSCARKRILNTISLPLDLINQLSFAQILHLGVPSSCYTKIFWVIKYDRSRSIYSKERWKEAHLAWTLNGLGGIVIIGLVFVILIFIRFIALVALGRPLR